MAISLQHPCHDHPLILRKLSENCRIRCSLCNLLFHGPTYCCLDCDFFLHKSCALVQLPPQIEHPSDSRHPLSLERGQYGCSDCGIGMAALRAIVTIPPEDQQEEVGETFQHFAHKHPLTSFHVPNTNGVNCMVCESQVFGRVFGCRSCRFLVHESCARLPRDIQQHPFHPEHPLTLVTSLFTDFEKRFRCRACSLKFNFAYFCDECEVSLDVLCAVSTLVRSSEEKEEGEHQLSCFVMKSESNIICQLCQLRTSGEVYCCFDCIIFLHKSCVEDLPQEIRHYSHEGHPLILRARPKGNRQKFHCGSCSCECCGITFHCESCQFDLHLQCAVKTLSAVENGAVSTIDHFAHEHPLTLLHFNEKIESDCHACKQSPKGLTYCCRSCKNFALHQSCAELPSQLIHIFHPQHPLTLLPEESKDYLYCSVCYKKSEGFTFHCAECHFYLDIECALKKATVKHERHERALVYFQRSRTEHLQCNSCGKSCNVDLYRCLLCNYNIHYDCLPLPATVQHNCHPYHQLVLCDKFVDGIPDDQYCDYCEEIRHPDHGVYRCAECWYTVHIECVIPTVSINIIEDFFFLVQISSTSYCVKIHL